MKVPPDTPIQRGCLLDSDGNHLGGQRRVMWNVVLVAQYHLQGVRAWWQLYHGFSLTLAKVQIVRIFDDVGVEFFSAIRSFSKRWTINEQMVVTSMPSTPNSTLKGLVTVSPFFKFTKNTFAPGAEGVSPALALTGKTKDKSSTAWAKRFMSTYPVVSPHFCDL
jgi:hypothetical protein